MCKAISVKSAVQKSAVGGAKNGGRGLEKKLYPHKTTNILLFVKKSSKTKTKFLS
jgi:hypothetical protein